MSDQPRVPTHLLPTEWGIVIATSTHPMTVAFTAGFKDTTPLQVNHVDYLCHIVISRAVVPSDKQRDREMLDGGWHVSRSASWHGLRRPGGTEATDAARRAFNDRILPAFLRWLSTDDARALVADGDRYWRRTIAEQIAATENDLVAAFQRLQDIATRVAHGDTITAADEEFAAKARVRTR
jgi:hypothetical protein